ncbi:ATP-dependent bile acid permease [Vanrija pseudolonga]|uniref:ATP-dependent bile acid permease n=1 Tax=Vanrija pseudolonga TaxID=143232 RepID=A0AAF1BKU7_9TREE|nr:ATP-dependent bile acid permease [Vanrija pseudolonga]
MASTFAIATTALIPLVSVVSFSLYITTHPASPVYALLHSRGVKLPTARDEALDGGVGAFPAKRDAFDIDDPVVMSDGVPVAEAQFWRWTQGLKIALLAALIPPFVANVLLLVFTIIASEGFEEHERLRAFLLPILLVPAHVVNLILTISYLRQRETRTHWPTTIYLAVNLASQFLILGILALLPSTPMPSSPISETRFFTIMEIVSLPPLKIIPILTSLLPLLQLVPLLIILVVRRGPALYIPFQDLYPSKVVDAIPAGSRSLNPNFANVVGEVQCTIPQWMMFTYAGEVIERSKVQESMDVWDLPAWGATMRALPNYLDIKNVYGRRRTRLRKWEGFNLLWKLLVVNKGLFIAQSTLAAVTAVGYYGPHLLLKWFLDYLANDPGREQPAWGWILALGLFVSNAMVYLVTGITWSISSTWLTGRFKLQLNGMLFAKTLRKKDIAAGAEDTGAVGDVKEEAAKAKKKKEDKEDEEEDEEAVQSKSQIMTLFTVDVDRVAEFIFHLFTIVDAPLEIVVATVFLVKLLGTSALFGLLTTICCMPLNHLASKFVVTAQENLMKTRDQRTALMNEVLQGIRMLKFMAWERSFERRINGIRKNELSWQARNYQIEVFFNLLWAITPVLVTVVSFLHFTLIRGETLTPSVAFTSIAVFNELRFALNALPETFIAALQGFVSCRRIEKYLSLAEVSNVEPFDGGDIVLVNATLTWPKDDSSSGSGKKSTAPTPRPDFSLADLSLRFPEGKLSLICGRLGSGKSLLLSGLLGEADLVAGQMVVPRSEPDAMSLFDNKVQDDEWIVPSLVAYVPQQAWLQNASIKDNIIFSSPWNAARYDAVIAACSLTTDLEILEDGDETEIGEKGLNLSGGQKARVSLARAVYSRASVLYLDDVLSAVDAHTAHAIMAECIQGPLLENRTVLLVSHHTALVSPAAAYIVALENGDVKFAGTRAEFVEGGLMAELDAEDPESKPTEGEKLEEKTIEETIGAKLVHKSVVSLSGAAVGSEPGSETSSIAPTDENNTLVGSTPEVAKPKAPRKLIEDEKRVRGRIAWPVWKLYFTSLGGPVWWFFFILSVLIAAFTPVFERGWVTFWTDPDPNRPYHSSTYYVVGYSIISVAGVILSDVQFAVTYIGSLRASRILQQKMLESVLFATLRFHDTTSRGRLLNRFGKDIEGLDSSMADNFVRSIAYALNVVVTVSSITYIGGWPFVAAGLLMLGVYYHAGSMYGQASRDMRRLDSVTRSPLYSLFGETVSGVAVIRAFGASTVALKQMMKLEDTNMLAFAWTWTINRWLSARFNMLSSLLVGVTACAMLVSGVNAAFAGFALAFATTIMHDLLFVVRRFVQLEQSMVALERIKEYSEVPQEAPEYVDPRPPASWPAEGGISVDKLVIRYAPDLPDVLHSISFDVKPREKVGIVGSTGCGKSTLALSFFRFVEATSGKIVIDGIDIAKIGLTDLRSNIMIIPQDPTILSGTLRSTLDVFDEYDDADIYEALRRVHLLKADEPVGPAAVAELSSGDSDAEESRNVNVFRDLSYPVSEGGENFSTGEKQLVCMARAILRHNKVLFMDEATASIDYETDELISKTIRAEFADSTILTIAHRIHTIIDFDKVLVMHRGSIAEYASPAELLRDHKSRFYSLCKATGKTEFKNLKELALEAERRRLGQQQ